MVPTFPNLYRFSKRLNPLWPWDPTSASSQISMSMMVSFLSKLLPQKSCHGNCYLLDVHNMMIYDIVNDVNKRCVCIHNIIFVWLFRLKIPEFPVIPMFCQATENIARNPMATSWKVDAETDRPINRFGVDKTYCGLKWQLQEKKPVLKQFQSINNHTSYYVLCIFVKNI